MQQILDPADAVPRIADRGNQLLAQGVYGVFLRNTARRMRQPAGGKQRVISGIGGTKRDE